MADKEIFEKNLGRLIHSAGPELQLPEEKKSQILEKLTAAGAAPEAVQKPEPIWRIIMKRPITRIAAAAVVVIAGILSIIFLDKAVTTVYAFEQTIEATNDIHYFHFKYLGPSDGNNLKEAWVEYDDSRNIKNVRVNFYKWGGQDMVMLWKQGKTQYWFKDKNRLESFEDKIYTEKVFKFVRRFDPKGAIKHLYDMQVKGDVKVSIVEPSDQGDRIVVTGTYLPGKYLIGNPTLPSYREVLLIDNATKLVASAEIYELKNGRYIDRGVWEYLDYNKPFDADIFNLDKEVPENVKRIDLMRQDIGLEQGELSENKVAVKVVREFLEALIAKDYAKAGKLHGIESPDDAKEKLANLNVVRIVSIGQPVLHGRPASIRVPYTIEIQKDEGANKQKSSGFLVHRVYGQPNRWQIIGGTN